MYPGTPRDGAFAYESRTAQHVPNIPLIYERYNDVGLNYTREEIKMSASRDFNIDPITNREIAIVGYGASFGTVLLGGLGGLIYAASHTPMSFIPVAIGAGIGFGIPASITTGIIVGKLIKSSVDENTCHWAALDCCGLFSKRHNIQDPKAGFALLGSESDESSLELKL